MARYRPGSRPRPIHRLADACGLRSTTSTRIPRSARTAARLIVVVVFPLPPFSFITATVRTLPAPLPSTESAELHPNKFDKRRTHPTHSKRRAHHEREIRERHLFHETSVRQSNIVGPSPLFSLDGRARIGHTERRSAERAVLQRLTLRPNQTAEGAEAGSSDPPVDQSTRHSEYQEEPPCPELTQRHPPELTLTPSSSRSSRSRDDST